MAGVFVGREAELHALREEFAAVHEGQSRVVLVDGPAGIGKTSLLRRFLAGLGCAPVAEASGEEAESHLPYGVVDQIVRSARHAVADLEDEFDLAPGADPLVVGSRLLEVIAALQQSGTAVIVIDDAQWADAPSLQALSFALRRLRADRVLTVLAAREDHLEHLGLVWRLVNRCAGRHVRLGGLDAAAVAELSAALTDHRPSRRAAERLADHTLGRPLYIRALLEEFGAEALGKLKEPLPAPRSFEMVVLARLAACSSEAYQLVAASAVVGQPVSLRVVSEVAGLDDPVPALAEACEAGLLEVVELAAERAVTSPHPLLRAAIYHDLSPVRRQALHGRAARVLGGADALEHQAAATFVDDPDLAARIERLARDEAQEGAWEAAAAHLLLAARLQPDAGHRGQLLLEAIEQLLVGGEVTEAGQLAERVAELPDSTRRRYVTGHLALLCGRQDEAEKLLSEAWASCDQASEPQLAAAIAVQLGQLCLLRARAAEAVAWGRRAMEAAGTDPTMGASATAVIVLGLGQQGHGHQALDLVPPAPNGRHGPEGSAEPLMARGVVKLWTDDPLGAGADLTAVADPARAWYPLRLRLSALGCLAKAQYRLGQWDDSVANAALAASLADDAEHDWALAFLNAVASLALAARGSWDAAEGYARRASEAAVQLGMETDLAYAAWAGAQLGFARADPAAVVAAIEPVAGLRRDGFEEPRVTPWRELHADALVSMGRLEEAEAVLAPFEALAASRRRRSSMAGAARVRGLLEAARGEERKARAAFEAGLAHLEGLPVPFERALLDFAYGRHLRRAGDRQRAASHLASADATFAQLGARPFRERCVVEVAACGLTPRERTPATRFSLTPQELAVARLVASGRTNREVAAQLVLSVKTVEFHLGNIYSKLGIHSRSALAARFATGSDPGGEVEGVRSTRG